MNRFTGKEGRLWLFLGLMSLLILAAFAAATAGSPHQNHLFFRSGKDFAGDYFSVMAFVRKYGTGLYCSSSLKGPCNSNYPPLAYLPYMAGGWSHEDRAETVPGHPYPLALLVWILLFAGGSVLLYSRQLSFSPPLCCWFAAVLLLSNVSLFSAERGNVMLFASLCVTFFLFFYRSENRYLREAALLALALAAGMKIFPAILGGLLLCRKEWKRAFRLTLYGLGTFFLPFLLFQGGFGGFRFFREACEGFAVSHFFFDQHVFYETYGRWIRIFSDVPSETSLPWIWGFFAVLSLFSLFLGFREKVHWRRVFLFLFPVLLLPPVSGRYNLLYLLPAVTLFFEEAEVCPRYRDFAVLLALMLSPLHVGWNWADLSPLINSILGDVLLFFILHESFRDNILEKRVP